jgi:hypothetical protein
MSHDPTLGSILISLIKDSEEALEAASKFGNENLFIDTALIASNLSRAVYRPRACSTKGPMRLYLKPSPQDFWSIDSRSVFYRFLAAWGKVTLAEADLHKVLAPIKDQEKKDQKKQEVEHLYRDIGICSRLALEHCISIGPVFSTAERRVQRDVVDWAVVAVCTYLHDACFDHATTVLTHRCVCRCLLAGKGWPSSSALVAIFPFRRGLSDVCQCQFRSSVCKYLHFYARNIVCAGLTWSMI